MIELTSKTKQDFLSREWVQKFLNVGVDMSDAKYSIVTAPYNGKEFVATLQFSDKFKETWNAVPTYTVSELMYKLHEWIYPVIDGIAYNGGLKIIKDAPFYIAYYALHDDEGKTNHNYIYAACEYPIEALALLLIQCHIKDIGIPMKDTGNISSK